MLPYVKQSAAVIPNDLPLVTIAVMPAPHGKKFRLLLVDDDAMTREFMAVRLTRQGYDMTVAEEGYRALQLLEHEPFDLLLLDIMMPGLSGLDVLTQVRLKFSMLTLPIIMVTANDLEESMIEALEKGANDYLLKPISMPVTLARIKTQLSLRYLSALKDEFVRFASHDLKKPLMLLRDIAGELQGSQAVGGAELSSATRESLDLLVGTADNMQNVVQGFLEESAALIDGNYARRSAVNINQMVMNAVQSNERYALRKGVQLSAVLTDKSLVVHGDAFQLSQVLDNLLGNAIKFSPQNSTTVVRTNSTDSYVQVDICDTGPGINTEDMGKLFTHGAHLGNQPTGHETSSGVGLVLCKQLVELHGGEIGARNNDGRGTTFWIRLPSHSNAH